MSRRAVHSSPGCHWSYENGSILLPSVGALYTFAIRNSLPTPGRSWYAEYRGSRKRKPSPAWYGGLMFAIEIRGWQPAGTRAGLISPRFVHLVPRRHARKVFHWDNGLAADLSASVSTAFLGLYATSIHDLRFFFFRKQQEGTSHFVRVWVSCGNKFWLTISSGNSCTPK